MARQREQQENPVLLDLNSEVFQSTWLRLDKAESQRVLDTLRKVRQMTWGQVYRDAGLKWEKITSVPPPAGHDAIYSIRITGSRRATVLREGNCIRFLAIAPDHDATYGRK